METLSKDKRKLLEFESLPESEILQLEGVIRHAMEEAPGPEQDEG